MYITRINTARCLIIMIMLKPMPESLAGKKIYKSSVGSKPGGAGLTTFTITHNQGKAPDRIQMYSKRVSFSDYIQQVDYYFTGENRGWFINNSGNSENQSVINVYRVDDGTGDTSDVFFQLNFDSAAGIN